MGAYVVRRLFFSLFVLWGAVTIIFVVLRLVPGDPAYIMLGPDADQAQVDALRAQLGLDHSLIQQYATYLANVVHLDFGQSFRLNADSMSLVLQRVPATIQLASTALLLSLLIGLPLGVIAALRANSWVDRSISVFSLMGQSTPSFWLGIVLILVFARGLQVLPSAGSGTWSHLVLPTITLALPFLAILVRLTRSGLLEVVHEGYVQTARAKGLGEGIVILVHALRNALIPIVTVVGLQFGALLGGTVIVETVFAWPGVGRLLIDSIGRRDYGVVQASILLVATIFVFINLLVDLLYGFLDPRVRLAGD
ncbi:peptide/nickel transport system permease protein/oligopeptide transport system permease protein [Kribbella steppae]|jgi:peptide/nickel transport system permease protein|uniref:Nickel import system permease protein NikB n=1 Tax=Kribbella steppae TaxID=2512223 RepID=A0A4R2HDP7_9ACTN|nr:nickel ABC transporter permease [Kribbella steppae]TCO26451.1 peptide/nickel transport system permease protein/oligopeptide transport system permease protein [Kribbella steppae]